MTRVKYGDVIGVRHGMYTHFGIYVDDNHVIHYDGKEDDKLLRYMYINETSIEKFLGGVDYYYVYKFSKDKSMVVRRNKDKTLSRSYNDIAFSMYMILKLKNKLDYKIYSPKETVRRARSRIGEKKFNLGINNCESFAMWCKTGVSESYQVNLVLRAFFVKSISKI